MKFHKERTAIRSNIEGIEAYRKCFLNGELISVPVRSTNTLEQANVWRVLSVSDIEFRDTDSTTPLEVSSVVIKPRAAVVDELTRHRFTRQVFIPITGPILGVVAASKPDDPDKPDPNQITMVPTSPGKAFEVGMGAWHTLPFTFASEVLCLSVMHRADLDSYHDVRDLAAEGWIGVVEWLD